MSEDAARSICSSIGNISRKGSDVMQPSVETIGDVTVVLTNLEQLDAANADDFRRDMSPILQNCRKLVLDLTGVQFADSRGCGAILSCLKQVSSVGGDLKLCQVSRPVRMVFELIRLHRVCEILATKEQAVQAFNTQKQA
jgi:anti-sigma B factor antagonist